MKWSSARRPESTFRERKYFTPLFTTSCKPENSIAFIPVWRRQPVDPSRTKLNQVEQVEPSRTKSNQVEPSRTKSNQVAMSLQTKNAFITGGASGLGKAFTESLLQSGARVVFVDINADVGQATEKELGEKYGADNVFFLQLDVTNKEKFEETFPKAIAKLGYIDLVVNNAGIVHETNWEFMILINTTAVIRGTYLAMEHMRKDRGGKGGRIVTISSIAGLYSEFFAPVYSATKQAVIGFSQALSLAPDQAETGVEFGVLCPGATDTNMVAGLDDAKITYFQIVRNRGSKTAPVSRVVEGFMELITQDVMNGAIYIADIDELSFCKLTRTNMSWPPSEKE